MAASNKLLMNFRLWHSQLGKEEEVTSACVICLVTMFFFLRCAECIMIGIERPCLSYTATQSAPCKHKHNVCLSQLFPLHFNLSTAAPAALLLEGSRYEAFRYCSLYQNSAREMIVWQEVITFSPFILKSYSTSCNPQATHFQQSNTF